MLTEVVYGNEMVKRVTTWQSNGFNVMQDTVSIIENNSNLPQMDCMVCLMLTIL